MINKDMYEDILTISREINNEATSLKEVLNKYNIDELNDFISTVLGYSKYLETTVQLHKDADLALSNLENNKK